MEKPLHNDTGFGIVYICENDGRADRVFDELFEFFNPQLDSSWEIIVLNITPSCTMSETIAAINKKYANRHQFRSVQLVWIPYAVPPDEMEKEIRRHTSADDILVFDSRLPGRIAAAPL